MKRISKLMSVLAAVAALASCEKETQISGSKEVPGGQSETLGNTEIVASFEDTKASYAVEGTGLRPSWEVGDVVIAIGDGKYAGETSKFTVKSLNPDGSANLQGNAHADCTLHLVYCPGAKQGTEIPVDYTAQTGAQKTMPAVMLSDGEVKNCKGEFKFRNAGAIIGISAVKGVPQNSKVTEITINGDNLSAATVALSGSALALTATTKSNDAISTATLSGITTTDANGTLSSPVFIAVPAGAKIAKVSASVTKEPETMKVPSTAADKKDIDYVEIEAKYDGTNLSTKKWAKWNVGANSQSEYGWYFAWAGTEGYVYKNSKWVSASGVDSYSYSLSSAKTAGASDYLYVKTQSFTPAGHSFDWANTPYQTQNVTSHSSTKFTKYLGSTSSSYKDPSATDADALKTALDPEDDAAAVNWGGTWRMPTLAEFQALYKATYCAWDATDKGCYVYAPNPATDAGKYNSGTGTYDKASALLFFPAAGCGSYADFRDAGGGCRYWSGSLFSSDPYQVYYLYFLSDYVNPQCTNVRYTGQPVRPVSD